jgi:hypothetical protein
MNREQIIAQAIRVGSELQDPIPYGRQAILTKRFTRLMKSLTIAENLQVRRGMGFPIDCHDNGCEKCDECWYRQLAINMLKSQGVDGEANPFLLKIAIDTIKKNQDCGLQ